MALTAGIYPDYPNIIVSDVSLSLFKDLNGMKLGYVEAVYAGCMEHQKTDYVVYSEGKQFSTTDGTFYFVNIKDCYARYNPD